MRNLCNGLALCPKHSCQSLSGYYEYTFNYDSLLIEVEPIDELWVLWQIEVEHVGLIFVSATLGDGDLNLSGLEVSHVTLAVIASCEAVYLYCISACCLRGMNLLFENCYHI